jgi:hypothetical protein
LTDYFTTTNAVCEHSKGDNITLFQNAGQALTGNTPENNTTHHPAQKKFGFSQFQRLQNMKAVTYPIELSQLPFTCYPIHSTALLA